MKKIFFTAFLLFVLISQSFALRNPEEVLPVFQFPADRIPCIDGNPKDWDIVPESYVICTDRLFEEDSLGTNIDTKNIDINVRVGWVKRLNRLYILYEAYDNYWDFAEDSLHNDILELVVDGDLSGGPFIKQFNPNIPKISIEDLHFTYHGVHAQNYHIFTPPGDKDWTMVWGCAQWLKDLPYANSAYSYSFRHGENGKLTLEFYITPFDFALYDNPRGSVESELTEGKIIGLSWVVLDYDGPGKRNGAYNLSGKSRMFCDASDLRAFRLMPLEKSLQKALEARWSFKIVDMDKRLVAFRDESNGEITKWTWDFGDSTFSYDRNPIHAFKTSGEKTVILKIDGPAGKSKFTRVWNIVLK